MKTIDFEKKIIKSLTNKDYESYLNQINCHIFKKKISNINNYRNYCKGTDHCRYTGKYKGAAHSICNLKYSLPKETPVDFHSGSNYDHHFIIKELAKEF